MLRKSIAAFFVFLFALFTIPTFLIRGITGTYLNEDFYKGEVVDHAYELIVQSISEQVASNEDINQYLTEDEIKNIIKNSFTVDIAREITTGIIGQLNAIIERGNVSKLHIDLLPLKEQIPVFAEQISEVISAKLPDCPSVEDMEISDVSEVSGFPSCVGPFLQREDLKPRIERQVIRSLSEEIPGEFAVDFESSNQSAFHIRQLLLILNYVQLILPLSLLIIWLIIALLVYKPYTLVMQYLGSAPLLGGILSLIIAQLIAQLPALIINTQNLSDIAAEEVSQLFEFYSFVTGFLVNRMSQLSLYFIGIGALMILGALFINHRRPHHHE